MNRKIRFVSLIAIIITIGILIGSTAYAGRYIVSSTATSTNWSAAEWTNYPYPPTCTPVTPQTAMSRAVAGDTIFFRGGTGGNYSITPIDRNYQTPFLNPSNSGTSGSPITFRNYPEETPIIVNAARDCSSTAADRCMNPVMGASGRDWIVIDGFQFGNTQSWSNEGYTAVRFEASRNCTVQNSVFKNLNNMSGPTYANPASVMIHGDGSYNVNTSVRNCYFTGGINSPGNRFNTIITYATTGTLIENVTIENAGAGINFKDGAVHSTVRFSFFRTISTDDYTHIKLAAQQDHPWNVVNIYQNVFLVASTANGAIGPHNTGAILNIYNNVFYGPGAKSGYQEQEAPNVSGVSFWNNVFARFSTHHGFQLSNRPAYCNYNIYDSSSTFSSIAGGTNYSTFSSWQSAGYDANGAREPIAWANPGGTSAADYKFTSTHKNSGRGGFYASVIGAYITGYEIIGYSNDISLSIPEVRMQSPSGLRVLR